MDEVEFELIFMGTGTSQGVPMIAHEVEDLDLTNPKNWRTRTSVHLILGDYHLQVDAAPEFRLQCIHNSITKIDSFILTHGHADHVLGMDDLRRFIDLREGEALPVWGTEEGLERIRQIYPYAICDRPATPGYPAFKIGLMPPALRIGGFLVQSTPLPHGKIEVLGLVVTHLETGKKIAYYTDCKRLTSEAFELAKGADILVLDALRPRPHPSHMSLPEAIETAHAVGAEKTYFTHMTFMIDHERDGALLPEGMFFAYDGLRLTC